MAQSLMLVKILAQTYLMCSVHTAPCHSAACRAFVIDKCVVCVARACVHAFPSAVEQRVQVLTLCLSALPKFLASQGASCAHLRSPVSEETFFSSCFHVVRIVWCVEHCTEAGWEVCAAEVPRSSGGLVLDMGLCLKCAYQAMRPVLSQCPLGLRRHGAYWAPLYVSA